MSSEFKHERQRMKSDVRAQGRGSRSRRVKVKEGVQTTLAPRVCPMCGSLRVTRQVKATFQSDGFYCWDCGHHWIEEGER